MMLFAYVTCWTLRRKRAHLPHLPRDAVAIRGQGICDGSGAYPGLRLREPTARQGYDKAAPSGLTAYKYRLKPVLQAGPETRIQQSKYRLTSVLHRQRPTYLSSLQRFTVSARGDALDLPLLSQIHVVLRREIIRRIRFQLQVQMQSVPIQSRPVRGGKG